MINPANEEDSSLSKLSPFVIEKAIKGCVGIVPNVKKLRSGCIQVEVSREAQATNLLKLNTFGGCAVKITPHRSMNSSKGVVRSLELSELSEQELLDGLADQGVTAAKHIYQKRDGNRQKTRTVILTFSVSSLPNNIKAGYLNIKVEKFIPSPLRCFKCQKFGHHQTTCRHETVCAKCGLAAHGEEPCGRPAHCVNCSGEHPAFYTTCPSWVKEKEICKIKTTQNISYPEARKLAATNIQLPRSEITYSSVLSQTKQTRTISTQTDVTNCKCLAPTISSTPTNKSTSNTQTESQTTDKTILIQNFKTPTNPGKGSTNKSPDKSHPSKHTRKNSTRGQSLSPHKPGRGSIPPGNQQDVKSSQSVQSLKDRRTQSQLLTDLHPSKT